MKWLLMLACVSGAVWAGEIERVMDPEFPGFLYRPKSVSGGVAGILLLHGSEGWGDYWGSPDTGENAPVPKLAQQLARDGYAAYALSYFDSRHAGYADKPVPKELAFIDLERTYKALQWFQRAHVQNQKLILLGFSRGAEQALLLASLIMKPEFAPEPGRVVPDLIVALSPSYMVHRGISDTLSQIVHGEANKKVRFDMLPAWRWGQTANVPDAAARTFSRGHKFGLNPFPNRILITHFDRDPSWGADADLSSLIASLPPADTLTGRMTPAEHASGNYQRVLSEIRGAGKNRVFIGYPDTGHGINRPYQKDLLLELMK